MRKFVIAGAVLVAWCGIAWATADTTVTLADPSGKPIPEGTVTLTRVDKKPAPKPKTAKTDQSGKITVTHDEKDKDDNALVIITVVTKDGTSYTRRTSLKTLLGGELIALNSPVRTPQPRTSTATHPATTTSSTYRPVTQNSDGAQPHIPGTSDMWIGGGLGFTTTDNRVTTIYQKTFNVFDPLSGYNSAGLVSTGFLGDIDFGYDRVLGNWPNWPNLGWGMPMTLGVAGSFGYSDTDKKVGRIPGSELFTANGPGTDYFRIQGGWKGSLGGRLGMYVTPSFLVYGSGGYAFQYFKTTVNCGTGLCEQNLLPQATLTQSQWRPGYYYGGGFMMPVPNLHGWTMGVELRETDYGNWTVTTGNPALYEGQFKVHLSEFSAMARVHYNFYP